MTRETKKGDRKSLAAVLFFLLIITAAFLGGTVTAVQGAEVHEVTRYAPAVLAPDSEFEVKVTIKGELPLVVGIVETVPEGFRFVSTTHPSEQYEVSGQIIAFVAKDETEITYRVQAPSSGEGSFIGTWIDILSDSEGSIANTIIVIGGDGADPIGVETPKPTSVVTTTTPVTTPKPSSTATPAATPTSEVPGFEAMFTAVSLLISCLFAGMQRTKGEGGNVK